MTRMRLRNPSSVTKTTPAVRASEDAISPDEIAIIGTSDRSAFRSCRRKWNWSSHLRQSLNRNSQAHPLWFGSGMHHVLEDLHGRRLYKRVEDAIDDYCNATLMHYGSVNLPETFEQDKELMLRMMQHYMYGFLKARGRDPLKTYVLRGEPQVEVPFEFEIPVPNTVLEKTKYKKVVYKGTLDRIVVDNDGYLWIQDYKNVSAFTPYEYLELDSQIGVYLWAASYIYKRPVIGFIYTQLKKTGVEPPRILKNGLLSAARDQNTTHAMYRRALLDKYGDKSWPAENMECLNHLAVAEEPEADKFIRRDRVPRSVNTLRAEADKIIAEASDILDPNLRIYPNPSYMCTRMCSFVEPCLEMDRGEKYRTTLELDYHVRDYYERNEWRKYLIVGEKEDRPPVLARADNTTDLPFDNNKSKVSVSKEKSAPKPKSARTV